MKDNEEFPNGVRTRVLWAVAAAFLLPGILVVALMPVLAPAEWNPGGLPLNLSRLAILVISNSLLGAVVGSPAIIASMFTWMLLNRLQLARRWNFVLTGTVAGAAVGLVLVSAAEFSQWGIVRAFSAAGALTGLIVWLIAYGSNGRAPMQNKATT